VKFSVVPESSERCTGVIAWSGRVASGFWSAMAGSFHFVIVPAKMPATVAGSRSSESTPSTLKITAIGEMYTGSSTMSVSGAHLANPPAAISSSLNARSEPAKSLAPSRKVSRPAPEPEGS